MGTTEPPTGKAKLERFAEEQANSTGSFPAELVSLSLSTLRLLARGQPVSPETAAAACGQPNEYAEQAFRMLSSSGVAEFDAEGRVVGFNGLTIKPTRHRFQLAGRTLYAWCALDTLGLPMVLKQTAIVESACPVTNGAIRLTVAPEKVETVEPEAAVVSLVAPGVGLPTDCNPNELAGRAGYCCSNIHFFASRKAAATWLDDHPGAEILTVEEAHDLARKLIEPYRSAL